MSIFAVDFPADGVTYGGVGESVALADIKAATALGITMSVRGDRFVSQTTSVRKSIAELAAGYLNIYIRGDTPGTAFMLEVASAVDGETAHDLSGVITNATIDTTKYYGLKAWWDASQVTNKQGIEIYDDTGTLIGSGYASVNTAIANGSFGDIRINKTAGQGVNAEGGPLVVDWFAAWSGMPPAGAPTLPTVPTTGLLRLYPFPEGSGTTTAESVDNATGQMTLNGTPSWVTISSPADHGTVTLSANPIAEGGGGTATIQWYDALNNPIADPGTTWSTVGNGATINAATGAYVWAGGGTVTIRATAGSVHADATLTLTRRLTITGTMTVS